MALDFVATYVFKQRGGRKFFQASNPPAKQPQFSSEALHRFAVLPRPDVFALAVGTRAVFTIIVSVGKCIRVIRTARICTAPYHRDASPRGAGRSLALGKWFAELGPDNPVLVGAKARHID